MPRLPLLRCLPPVLPKGHIYPEAIGYIPANAVCRNRRLGYTVTRGSQGLDLKVSRDDLNTQTVIYVFLSNFNAVYAAFIRNK